MATQTSLDKETLLWMHEKMVTIRRFEEQAKREADAGKLRGMHSSIGQEAVPTGMCAHLRSAYLVACRQSGGPPSIRASFAFFSL